MILRRAILLLERKWTQKQIEWDVDMDEATYTGNESLMLHGWVNLLDNAIKFDPVGGEIRLRLHCESTCIRITVSDNGPGIPKDQQSAIFERFYQADGSHKSEGNGLGLALARRIVRMCGGEISVSSEPGKGSCFTVELPSK